MVHTSQKIDRGAGRASITLKTCLSTLAALFLVVSLQAQQRVPILPKTGHHLVVIAHRGNHINVPENTLAAYEAAIVSGADYVEVDLRTTKDGHLVILHDASVERMTGNKGTIKELTYSQIKQMTIHSLNTTDTTLYRIPDFASVLQLCHGRIHLYLDFKEADVAQTYQLIQSAGMEHEVVVYLNHEAQYDQWKKVAPQMPLMSSLPEHLSARQLDSLMEYRSINIVDNAYDAEHIRLLHRKSISVWLDVESKGEGPALWDKTLAMGPDGLQTDHPAALIAYLKKKGIR